MPPREEDRTTTFGRFINSDYMREVIAEWAETVTNTDCSPPEYLAPDSVLRVTTQTPHQRIEVAREYRRHVERQSQHQPSGMFITDEGEDPFRTGRATWSTSATPVYSINSWNTPKAVAPKKAVVTKCTFPDEEDIVSGTQILVPFTELSNIDGRIYRIACANISIGVYSKVWVQQAERVWRPSPVLVRHYPTYSSFADNCLSGFGNGLYFSGLLTDEVMEKEKIMLVRACGHSLLAPEELKDVLIFRYVRDNKISSIAKRVYEGTKAYDYYKDI
jgi:hypothetical protein